MTNPEVRITFGSIVIDVDKTQTTAFYQNQQGFTCTCPDCLGYVEEISRFQELLDAFGIDLGIDISKDVGQGMDELMLIDYDDHSLYVVPYYISGTCLVDHQELKPQAAGPIWPTTKLAEYKFNDQFSLKIINTTGDVQIDGADSVLSIWLEFKADVNVIRDAT